MNLFHTFKVPGRAAPLYLNNLILKYIQVTPLQSESCSPLKMQKNTQQCTERNLSKHQFSDCEIRFLINSKEPSVIIKLITNYTYICNVINYEYNYIASGNNNYKYDYDYFRSSNQS